jgi:ApaG protein
MSAERAIVRAMSSAFKELIGLSVRIDAVLYSPQLDAPPERPYPFVYYITIENQSPETVTIKGRKWVVTDKSGGCIVVEGDGVVGKYPRLEPGERFSYNSYHTISSDSVAEGSYIGINDEGVPVMMRIPQFEMRVPGNS